MARKVLVTGVAGFIGSHLAKELLAQRYEVYGIDNLSTGKVENVPLGVEFRIISVADLTVEDLRGFDVVFHQAALQRVSVSISDPVSTNYHNVSSFVKLLKTCVDAKVPRVVFASSSSVYGDQTVFPLKETLGLNGLSRSLKSGKKQGSLSLSLVTALSREISRMLKMSLPPISWLPTLTWVLESLTSEQEKIRLLTSFADWSIQNEKLFICPQGQETPKRPLQISQRLKSG